MHIRRKHLWVKQYREEAGHTAKRQKEERSRKLIELSDKNEIEYNESYIGKNVEVLFEEEKDGIFKGHTQNYIMVYCELNKNLENQVISVRCEKAEQEHILGNFIVQQ